MTSALGHKRTFTVQKGGATRDVRFVPKADIRACLFKDRVGVPADENQHDQKSNHVGDRNMPAVAKP